MVDVAWLKLLHTELSGQNRTVRGMVVTIVHGWVLGIVRGTNHS